MRLLLAELAPRRGEADPNLEKIRVGLGGRSVDLAVFPEMFVTGYALGDRVHQLALREGGAEEAHLADLARSSRTALIVGAPRLSTDRLGEVENVALAFDADGSEHHQAKRYLPSFGPFEEGHFFTPARRSGPIRLAGHPVGIAVCYDAFFPEVFRSLALDGAELLVVISASPVTSRRMFERILPARAIENACPLVYVNRVGVEDGIVFGGGTAAWDARGEPLALESDPKAVGDPDERLYEVEIDLTAARGWRPFRPVLRDAAPQVDARQPPQGAAGFQLQPRP
ncbi:MAG: carbon-nitrogen hydrolase family protein [Thermoplasmata archaeon]